MPDAFVLLSIIVIAALIFDFINGFHDAANATATIVATRVLKHWQAVIWAALFNFIALFVVSSGVAKTVGSGLIDLTYVTPQVILAALLGGIIWNLYTWWKAIPASSSHTLIGSYAGAVCAHVLLHTSARLEDVYIAGGWIKVLAFIIIAPLVGYLLGFGILRLTEYLRPTQEAKREKRFYKAMQLFSSALLSFNHGANDAQKTAGVIATALVATGHMAKENFYVPDWAFVAAYITIALGTLSGGWRITKTLGFKLVKLKPIQGFSAETGAALSIALATWLHMPISTTLSITGSIVGVGSAKQKNIIKNDKRVEWPLFYRIALIWGLTLPVSFAFGFILLYASSLFVN